MTCSDENDAFPERQRDEDSTTGCAPLALSMEARAARSPAIQRLIDEVRNGELSLGAAAYDRVHNRHNRSC
jgi:hypothetical protein